MDTTDIVFRILDSICAEDISSLAEEETASNRAALVQNGGEFDFAGIRFIRLGEEQGGILCVTKDVTDRIVFNNDWKNNNYRDSAVREYILQDFANKIPREELLPYTMDLRSSRNSEDGHGYCTDMAGILTEELYRKYRRFIRVDDWEWLCTPYSTFLEDPWVMCVDASGYVSSGAANVALRYRPACIFKK